jgi:hypothetical protein
MENLQKDINRIKKVNRMKSSGGSLILSRMEVGELSKVDEES